MQHGIGQCSPWLPKPEKSQVPRRESVGWRSDLTLSSVERQEKTDPLAPLHQTPTNKRTKEDEERSLVFLARIGGGGGEVERSGGSDDTGWRDDPRAEIRRRREKGCLTVEAPFLEWWSRGARWPGDIARLGSG